MKKSFLSIVVFLVFAAIGCQENFLTDPLMDTQDGVQKNSPSHVRKGTIVIDGIINNPAVDFTGYSEIAGKISYELSLVSVNQLNQYGSRYNATLTLDVKAEITNQELKSSRTYKVVTKSSDAVYVGQKQSRTFTKSFPVENKEGKMSLVCVFAIDSESVSLVSRWIEFTPNPKAQLITSEE